MFTSYRLFACAILLLIGAPNTMAKTVSWLGIYANNEQKIGHIKRYVEEKDTKRTVEFATKIVTKQKNSAKVVFESVTQFQFDDMQVTQFSRTTTIENTPVTITGKVHNDYVQIVINTNVETLKKYIDIEEFTQFDGGEQLLTIWDFKLEPELSFNNFNINNQEIESVKIVTENDHLVRTIHDSTGQLLRSSKIWLAEDQSIAKIKTSFIGIPVTIISVEEHDVKKSIKPLNVLSEISIPSPYRIPKRALVEHIRYIFKHDGQSDLSHIPTLENQAVSITDGNLVIDICESCGRKIPERDLSTYLKANRWMQSDHKKIQQMVTGVFIKSADADTKMRRLKRLVVKNIENIEFGGHFSALEAIKHNKGDCTEYAVLLAALGRAANIPTRVVSGLAYSQESYHGISNVFIPHAWVQAYIDGQWRSYDAALGEVNSTYITLNIGNGEPKSFIQANALANSLSLEHLAQIKTQ